MKSIIKFADVEYLESCRPLRSLILIYIYCVLFLFVENNIPNLNFSLQLLYGCFVYGAFYFLFIYPTFFISIYWLKSYKIMTLGFCLLAALYWYMVINSSGTVNSPFGLLKYRGEITPIGYTIYMIDPIIFLALFSLLLGSVRSLFFRNINK